MGLLGRLAKLGSGLLRKAGSKGESLLDELDALQTSDSGPMAATQGASMEPGEVAPDADETDEAPTGRAPDNTTDPETKASRTIEATERDGNRRTL